MKRVLYEREYWQREASKKNIEATVCDMGLDDACFQALHIKPRGKILEIGCGIGRLLKMFDTKENKRCKFYGIDISPKMLKRQYKLSKNFETVLCNGRYIPFNDSYFDIVYSLAVFQHIDNDGVIDYIQEVRRVLKKDGVFRFQFVIGEEKIAFSWQRSLNEMMSLMINNGIQVIDYQVGLVFPNWGFISAEKAK